MQQRFGARQKDAGVGSGPSRRQGLHDRTHARDHLLSFAIHGARLVARASVLLGRLDVAAERERLIAALQRLIGCLEHRLRHDNRRDAVFLRAGRDRPLACRDRRIAPRADRHRDRGAYGSGRGRDEAGGRLGGWGIHSYASRGILGRLARGIDQ